MHDGHGTIAIALPEVERVRDVRCLIVDDNAALTASVSSLLISQGINVVATAVSGDEALRLAEQLKPDIALIDIELGGEDGMALSHRFAARAAPTRVILVSSYAADELGDLVERCPVAGFLAKSELSASAIACILG